MSRYETLLINLLYSIDQKLGDLRALLEVGQNAESGDPKEIAALVLAVQERQAQIRDPMEEFSRQEDFSQHHNMPEESA